MSRKQIFTTICRYGIEFTLCSFCGWLYEVLLNLVVYDKFTDRGVLHLPLCPIYGFAGLALLLLFHKYNGWLTVFLGSAIIPTVLELVTFEPLRQLMGYRLWNYSKWWLNYKGMISLPSSLIFGLLGLLLVKGVHPAMDMLQEKAPAWLVQGLGVLCAVLILGDAVWTFTEKLW